MSLDFARPPGAVAVADVTARPWGDMRLTSERRRLRQMTYPSVIGVFLATTMLALAAGCAGSGPNDYARSEARVIQTVAHGTVERVRMVRLTEDRPIMGTIAGAAIGGLLGNSIGSGNGRAAATVIGAVGGGIAGNAVERHVGNEDGQEIIVRLDNGDAIAVVQAGIRGFEPGQRVRVLTGPKGSRVEQG